MLESVPTRAPRRDSTPSQPTVSVVIPAMNEAANLPHVFAAIPNDVFEVILVDGRSVDDTVAVARELLPTVRVIHQNRRGKGNALACGFAVARGDIIVMIDADGSTNPEEIPAFVGALRQGADFAKGTRFVAGGGSSDITRFRALGNRALNGIVNVLFRTSYTDLCYGYNAFWRCSLPAFFLDAHSRPSGDPSARLWGDGFEIETVINLRAARARLRVVEVPSYERERMHGTSNLNAFSDGLRVLRTIVVERARTGSDHAAMAGSPARERDVVIDLVSRSTTTTTIDRGNRAAAVVAEAAQSG